MKRAITDQESQRLFWIASLMFFLSGGTGLAYQVIWFKRFAHVWGSSSLAFASVGGSFLFGLGVGAYLLGRYADRVVRPLRWYGMCELAIGVLAIVIPLEIQFMVEQSAGFYSRLPGDPLLRFLMQFGVTLLVVGPPCVLMGGTLPLLIRELTSRDGRLDQATGWLYAINTFGAAAGCFLTGFWLLPHSGLVVANYLAAAVNLSIGAVAMWMTRSETGAIRKSNAAQTAKAIAATEATVPPATWNPSLIGLYVAVTLSGLGALILEMTWSRQLALLLGGSTYTYSATLFVVLVGIASGSLAFHLFLRRFALNPWLPVAVIGALAISCLLAKLLIPQLAVALMADIKEVAAPGEIQQLRQSLSGNALVCVLASICLELIPSIAMGILFPLFVDLTRASANRVGRTVGDVYAWNTFGSIVGASLTAVLLFPWIGTFGSIALATGLYVVALVLVLPFRQLSQILLSASCLAVGAALVAGILVPQDPFRLNAGMYLYGTRAPTSETSQCLYFAEGASSNVLVATQGPYRNLRVNGKIDASDLMDMATQAGLAYLPRLFKPDAEDVLVIGFGSGTTSGVSLLFPDTKVTCCEIEPAVYGAAKLFGHVNHKPHEQTRQALIERNAELPEKERLTDAQIEEQARFKIVFGDGRTTLQGGDQKFDLILSEPSNPWLAGVSNLFTREFFRAARTHLKTGGVLAQWVQTYGLTRDEYFMIVRTLRSEFPHCVICTASPGDTVLLASEQPIAMNPAALDKLQKVVDQSPQLTADLRKWFNTSDLRLVLLSHFNRDERTIDQTAGVNSNLPLNTDLNLLLEFLAPLHLYTPVMIDDALQIVRSADLETVQSMAIAAGISPESAAYQQLLGLREMNILQYPSALPFLQRAQTMESNDKRTEELLLLALRETPDRKLAMTAVGELVQANPENEKLVVALADDLGRNNQLEMQRELLKEYVDRDPKLIRVRDKLAIFYILNNNHAAALEILRQLDALRPNHAPTLATLGEQLSALKRSAEAVQYLRRALEIEPKLDANSPNWQWANELAWIYATSMDPTVRNGREAVDLATRACEAIDFKSPAVIDTLACAYAENAQFDEAIQQAKKFAGQLKSAGASAAIVQAAEDRVRLFESGQPFRER